jgi:hypothetical protein
LPAATAFTRQIQSAPHGEERERERERRRETTYTAAFNFDTPSVDLAIDHLGARSRYERQPDFLCFGVNY